MDQIRQYHLHKDDYEKLHFDIHDAGAYLSRNLKHCYKAHRHSFYQLIWFKNTGSHYVDYEIIEHPANTLIFINKSQIHYFCEQSTNEGYLFHFDEVFLDKQNQHAKNWIQYRLFNEIDSPFVTLENEEEISSFQYFTNTLIDEITERQHNFKEQLFYLFHALLLKVERLKQEQVFKEKVDDNFILAMSFKQLIDDHIHELMTIDHYSQLLGVNSKKLTSVSKQFLQNTPSNVIHERKILEAKRSLSNLGKSIKEIAYSLGFDQPTYFTKYFKKHTGITPKEFVKQLP